MSRRADPLLGTLTENDLETIKGQRRQLEGILQQRYGIPRSK